MTQTRCSGCGVSIECCEFCDRTECAAATCFTCVQFETGIRVPDVHDHGG